MSQKYDLKEVDQQNSKMNEWGNQKHGIEEMIEKVREM